MADFVRLGEHPGDMVYLACNKCERRGRYRKAARIDRYSPEQNMVALRLYLGRLSLGAGSG